MPLLLADVSWCSQGLGNLPAFLDYMHYGPDNQSGYSRATGEVSANCAIRYSDLSGCLGLA